MFMNTFSISAGKMPKFWIEGEMRSFVMKAVEDVSDDIERIFGVRPKIDGTGCHQQVIVLRKEGTGFETYSLKSREENVLEITGSDDRGVMFGLYRFASDYLGVDPLWWFSRLSDGSSPSHAHRDEMRWANIDLVQGEPSVRYRGWFINDEDFLNGFKPAENGKRAIDYERYHVCFGTDIANRIYEAVVRSGFNTVICASYVDILNPDEKSLVDIASSRGLYITMHHQEPVGAGGLQMDVHFPEMRGTTYASHPDLWRKAWRKYIEEWAKYPDIIFMLGLRGRRDLPFWTRPGHWEDARIEVDAAETKRRADLISQAMAEQFSMIREVTGLERPLVATQLWMEGADFYHKGLLTIPEGTVIVFSDNCPGLKFQSDIGSVSELPRGKKYGLYYHLAIVHGNHRCELVPPVRTCQILRDVHAKGASELLLVNVSNIRQFKYTIAATCKMACDLKSYDPVADTLEWCRRRFGDRGELVKRAADLYFAAYETVPSRDCSSSYGSPRDRAPVPALNDGIVNEVFKSLLNYGERSMFGVNEHFEFVRSQYETDPDVQCEVPADQWSATVCDMFPYFANRSRIGPVAAAQSAGMQRALDALSVAEDGMDENEKETLFFAFGFETGIMFHVSRMVSELALRFDAHLIGNAVAEKRHLSLALAESKAIDELHKRFSSGIWTGWFDRDLIYPYSSFTKQLTDALK